MRETWAWVAGLLEVGGWIGMREGQPGIQIIVPREVALTLVRKTGMGQQHGPLARGRFAWSVQDADHVRMILQSVRPWMSRIRQQEADTVMYQGTTGDGS